MAVDDPDGALHGGVQGQPASPERRGGAREHIGHHGDALDGHAQRDQAVTLRGRDDPCRFPPEGAVDRVGESPDGGAGRQGHQGPLLQVLSTQAGRRLGGGGPCGIGQHGRELLGGKGQRRQVVGHLADDSRGGIRPAHAYRLDQLLGVLHGEDLDPHPRMLPMEAPDQVGQLGRDERRQTCQPQPPGLELSRRGGHRPQRAHLPEHPPPGGDDAPPRARELHPPAHGQEQARTEGVLEGPDASREGGLGDAQRLGRSGEGAVIDDRDQRLQLREVRRGARAPCIGPHGQLPPCRAGRDPEDTAGAAERAVGRSVTAPRLCGRVEG